MAGAFVRCTPTGMHIAGGGINVAKSIARCTSYSFGLDSFIKYINTVVNLPQFTKCQLNPGFCHHPPITQSPGTLTLVWTCSTLLCPSDSFSTEWEGNS